MIVKHVLETFRTFLDTPIPCAHAGYVIFIRKGNFHKIWPVFASKHPWMYNLACYKTIFVHKVKTYDQKLR